MKATELMIGNWIYENIDEEEVDVPWCWVFHKVTAEDFKFWLDNDWIDVSEKEYFEFWRPIPLTPEIMEKIGFVNDFYEDENVADYTVVRNEGYSLHCKADGFDDALITWCNRHLDIVTDFNGEIKKDINYVHELQNLMTLCKIDKQIEL